MHGWVLSLSCGYAVWFEAQWEVVLLRGSALRHVVAVGAWRRLVRYEWTSRGYSVYLQIFWIVEMLVIFLSFVAAWNQLYMIWKLVSPIKKWQHVSNNHKSTACAKHTVHALMQTQRSLVHRLTDIWSYDVQYKSESKPIYTGFKSCSSWLTVAQGVMIYKVMYKAITE